MCLCDVSRPGEIPETCVWPDNFSAKINTLSKLLE